MSKNDKQLGLLCTDSAEQKAQKVKEQQGFSKRLMYRNDNNSIKV